MIKKLKKIERRDIIGIYKFFIVLIPSVFYKLYLKICHKELWLICERENMARDNGYIFYKFLKENHPEIKSYYAIDLNCKDYQKVKKYGNIIGWASLKHYYIYMSATRNISSHKEGNPNHPLFSFLHLYLHLYNNRVFLQHGVLYQNFPMFYKKNTNFKIFITGAKGEYDFIKANFGYKNEVKYTGLARFDNLYNYKKDDKIILLIPTWRRWLNTKDDFVESEYYKKLYSLINSKKLEKLLEKYDKYLYFYPHLSTQKFISCYKTNSGRVKVLSANNTNIQDLLKKGSLLITDFSSIFTDFAYMHKPIIYYQYDENEFYKKHYGNEKSYFNFKKDGFGKVVNTEDELLKQLNLYIKNGYKEEDIYKKRIDNFFILHDRNNCERIYNSIIGDKSE